MKNKECYLCGRVFANKQNWTKKILFHKNGIYVTHPTLTTEPAVLEMLQQQKFIVHHPDIFTAKVASVDDGRRITVWSSLFISSSLGSTNIAFNFFYFVISKFTAI